MSSNSGRYRPFPAYLNGGRADGGWISKDKNREKKLYGSVGMANFEHDARLACRELLGRRVKRTGHPSGKRRRSVRFYLKGGRSVIATQRTTPARAELEFRVLQELRAQGALVPKVLAFDGRFLFQEDLGGRRLSKMIRKASLSDGEKFLDSALTSLAEAHATAKVAGLKRHVVTLGKRENWRRTLITRSRDLGKFLGVPTPNLPVDKLVERLAVSKPNFIKWDARPANAIVVEDGSVAWIDWEHCGRRNRLDDLVWLLGDQTIPDWPEVEDRLLDRHLPAFLDEMDLEDARDYLAVYGTFHMCNRLGMIVNKQNGTGLEDWSSVVSDGNVKEKARASARRASIRASRWAARSPLTANLSPWLLEVAELFQDGAARTDAKDRANGGSHPGPVNNVGGDFKVSRGNGVDAGFGSEMKLLSASVLSGFNTHHSASVIRQEVDLGGFAGMHSELAGPGFADRFMDRFLGLETLPAQGGLPDGFLDRLKSPEGAPLAEVLFQAILAVEASMAFAMRRLGAIDFSEIEAAPSPERVFLVWSCRVPEVSRRAAEVGLIGLTELLPEALRRQADVEEGGFEAAYGSLRTYAERRRLDYNSAIMVQAAEWRGIPWEPIGGRLIRLGQGKFQHHIKVTATQKTSFLAQKLALDKRFTNRVLADLRIPVPRQAKPRNIEETLTAAVNIGYPVVVKPLDGNTGKGVCAGLKGPDEIPSAFERASQFGSGVIVESFVEGRDHRLLVVDGRLIAATKRVPPFITGDGRQTIEALIEELNSDPRRDDFTLKKVTLDDELNRLIDRAGYRLDSVLGKDESFVLRSMANYHTGGTTTDVTDRVHPDNRKMVIRAAGAIGLDVAGVDFLITDIGLSYKEVGGAIIEINASPGLDLHTWPAEGQPREVAGAVIEVMFPPGSQGRVPIALVTGAQGSGLVGRVLNEILGSAGMTVGLVTGKGAFVNAEPAGPEGAGPLKATRSVLRDRRVEALVRTVSPLRVARRGLLHDACEVVAIVDTASNGNIAEARQGLDVIVRATRGKLAVGAGNTLALEAARDIDPGRLVLVSRNADNAAVRSHLEAGGQAVVTTRESGEREIVVLEGETTVATFPISAVPSLDERRSLRRLDAQLFAVALARGMGISDEEIVSAIQGGHPKSESPDQPAAHTARPSSEVQPEPYV